jgi:exonuclease 1
MHRVKMLIYFGVTPYLVFDGDNLPSKAATEAERAKRREESKRRGLELYKARKVSQAYPEFQKAVDVTPYMARQLIEELKKLNIQYVVAPYEADAQLAYLEKKGIIDGILSEDSDLLVYGARRLITKLDQHGDCIEICRSDFASCRDLKLAGFTDADFRHMAILSGCDYLASINKVGLKTAHTYVRRYKNIEKILRMLQFEQKFIVPNGYLEQFYEAERTFLHHRVFCPSEKKLILFTDLEDGMKEEGMLYLGADVIPATAIGVACGDLDPMTKQHIRLSVARYSRSAPELYRRQTLASADDLKPSKSLDNFFKPKRQPLAELDPNSLTPSPSQQRLLQLHRDASWEARPVFSAPQLRRTTSALPSLDQQGLPRQSAERLSFLERAATRSTFQPPKRIRLCSDVEISPSGRDGQSRFFANEPEPSPSMRKTGKTKKARRSDIEIFSDDSVADIFQDMHESSAGSTQNMPEAHPSTLARTPSPKSPHAGATPVTAEFRVPDSACRTRSGNMEANISANEADEVSPTMLSPRKPPKPSVVVVSADDNSEHFEDALESHVQQLNSLRNTFAYQPTDRQSAALKGLSPPVQKVDKANVGTTSFIVQPSQGRSAVHLTAATKPKQSQDRPSLSRTFSSQSSSQQIVALKSLGQKQSPLQKVELGFAALEPSSSRTGGRRTLSTPLQRLGQRALSSTSELHNTVSIAPVTVFPADPGTTAEYETAKDGATTTKVQGSEDLLVPNSEDESSEVSEVENIPVKKPWQDLTRFLFPAST